MTEKREPPLTLVDAYDRAARDEWEGVEEAATSWLESRRVNGTRNKKVTAGGKEWTADWLAKTLLKMLDERPSEPPPA